MRLVLGISGGIAAYKTPDLVRRLRDAGAEVRVIATPNATRFVTPLSLAAVSDHGVIVDQWGDPSRGGVDHIEIARWAELLLIAPATANIIAKLAAGIADDALTTYALAHRQAIMVAPAMNTFMLRHPTVVANVATLLRRGVHIIEPDAGLLACGDEGAGRMPDIPVIVDRVLSQFHPRDLADVRLLVTAGPTREPIDPVRFLTNRSSGKMGYAIAAAAQRRGASVTLVAGPTNLVTPPGVEAVHVTTAQEMHDAVIALAEEHDIVIKAAAVADFTPVTTSSRKIKKQEGVDQMNLTLRRTPDILATLGEQHDRPFLVAFAAETDDAIDNAKAKLVAKNADMIVVNDVSDASIGFDVDQNEVVVLSREGEPVRIPRAAKARIAERILDLVVARITKSSEALLES